MGVRWRTADGAIRRLSVNEVSRRRLLELAMTAGVGECVGARLMNLRQLNVNELSRRRLHELAMAAES